MNVLSVIMMRPRKFGTVEEYCLSLAGALSASGNKAVFGFPESPPDWLYGALRERGAFVERVDTNDSAWSQFVHLRNLARKYEIDIIHCTFVDILTSFTLWCRLAGIARVIMSDQCSRRPMRRSMARGILKRFRDAMLLPSVNAVVADARFVRDDLVRYAHIPTEKVRIIYNGVNQYRFTPSEKQEARFKVLHSSTERKIVTTVANCIPEKGLDVFLRAAAIVADRRNDALFLVVGDGPLLESLQQLAIQAGLKDCVRFLGLRNDVERILQATDVFVLCSLWQEAFAFSLLEAMASGCPVVASHTGAIPESVKEGETGFLVEPGDAHGTADAIIHLLSNDALSSRMSVAARRRIEQSFTMDHWIHQTVCLYEELAGP